MQNLEFINKILEAMQYKIQELEIDKEEIKITFGDENLSLRDKFILVSIVALMGLHFPDS